MPLPVRCRRVPAETARQARDVQPVFPAEGFGSGQGKVLLQAVITEHGSMTELRVANPTQQFAHYRRQRGPRSVCGGKPPSKDGCPMPMFSTVTVTYTFADR